MRVLLRHTRSGLLFQEPDQWTTEPEKAHTFRHSAEAMDWARQKQLRQVEVLLAFDHPQCHVALPLPWPLPALDSHPAHLFPQ